ncbi:MAG: tetratricopeptide repeat protein [Lachnospiraceae bacterium]
MEKEVIFHVLGIMETKDEGEIRRAYHEQLRHTNPEDDPQGFQRLRQAYEEALVYARKPDETAKEEEEPKTEIDCWIQKVDAIYQDIHSRADCEKWKELLEDEVCVGLDTELETREKLLVYLMDHVQLPHAVWKLIGDTFDIVAEIEDLKQVFPANFLNYVCYYIENETFLPYELLDYRDLEEDGSSTDTYLEAYFSIKRKLDAGELEEIEQNLSDLEAYSVYHPFEDIEWIRFFLATGKKERAVSLARSVMEKDWYQRTDVSLLYAWLYVGEALYEAGEKERAAALWEQILEEEPKYYRAKFDYCRYLLEKEDYYEAKEQLLELMDLDDRNEEAVQMIHEANDHLIAQFKEELAEGKEDEHFPGQELPLELGWNLFQNDHFDEAKKLLTELEPDEEHLYDYNNLFGCLLYQMEEYQKAIPYLEKWLKLNEALTDDGTEKTRKRISRRGRACHTLGSCYYKAGRNEDGYAMMQKAIANYKDPAEKLNGMQFLANQILEQKEYEKAIAISEQILAEDDTFYPAYLIQQEAYYYLYRGQEVVDNYYRAISIFPGYYKPYLYAAMVFFQYGQYKDAKGVLDRAKENEVEFSPWMKLYEVKILRNLETSAEAYKQMFELLDELDIMLEKGEKHDLEDVSEVAFERAVLYWNQNKFAQALEMLQKALVQNPKRMQYRLVRGHIYQDMEEYEKALEEYAMAQTAYEKAPDIFYAQGRCYEALGQQRKALSRYRECLKRDALYRDANEKLSDYYAEKYQRHYHKKDYEKAIHYATKQLESQESGYYYVNRGLIYMDAYDLKEAIADFEKALEFIPEDWAAWNNLGCCYKYLGDFEKAVECLNKAAACMQTSEKLPYGNMADCYEAQQDFAKTRACYEKNLEMFPDDLSLWEEIGDTYYNEGNMEKAREAYEHAKGREEYYTNLGDICLQNGEKRKAVRFYKKRIKAADAEAKSSAYENLGNLYTDEREFRKAIASYKRATVFEKEPVELFGLYAKIARAYVMLGDRAAAKNYASRAKEMFAQSNQGTEEEFLDFEPRSPQRYGVFGWIYFCLGQTEKTEQMFRKMGQMLRCRNCRNRECFESYLYLGLLYELREEYDAALTCYRKVLEIVPNDIETKNCVRYVERKITKQK